MPVTRLSSKWVNGNLHFIGPVGRMRIGQTDDVLYGGDVSSDEALDGITVVSADGYQHFALDVYADDGGTELAAGWVSTIFGNLSIYTAVTPSANLSAFGATGQVHLEANVATTGNLAGVYGIAETVSGVTVTGNFFGATLGAVVPSGATLDTGYYTGGLIIGGSYAGTISGKAVAIFVQNPTSTKQFDAFAALGQDSQYAGCVTAAAVGGSNTHKVKMLIGGTTMYIPLYTA